MGQMISYKRPDGKSVPAYLAEPAAGASGPGIVVIQEWWGLNERWIARRPST
jgi:carboxymethylenebutenolidase